MYSKIQLISVFERHGNLKVFFLLSIENSYICTHFAGEPPVKSASDWDSWPNNPALLPA